MSGNDGVRFTSSSVRIPRPSRHHLQPFNFPFCPHNVEGKLSRKVRHVVQFMAKFGIRPEIPQFGPKLLLFSSLSLSLPRPRGPKGFTLPNSSLLCCASLSLSQPEESPPNLRHQKENSAPSELEARKGHSVSRNDEERVLISEVLVRNKDGEELERKELEMEAMQALKACRANSALTVREVQDDVHRIIESGYFCSCMPVAVDTRDGIRLVFQVEPNQEFHGLVCQGANVLPSKFLEDAFGDGHGKVVNLRRLDEVVNSINNWYMERGLFGLVSDVEILSGGILKLHVAEAEVNNISIRFHDRKTGEPTTGKTKPETILRQLTTKKGQVYSMLQGRRDVETVLTMGIMEDVSIIPQPAGAYTGKVDLIMNCVERKSGGFSAGGGISILLTLIGMYWEEIKKLNISLERGQIDSIIRINYTDPWIERDDKRTSRTIMVQNSTTPGSLVHGNQPDNSNLTIARVTSGLEFSRPLPPKWSGTAGIVFQHAGARDEKGNPVIKDFYSNPLTASENTYDDALLSKVETVYTGSGDHGSSMFAFNMGQGLPVLPDWLFFNRVNARARKGIEIGPARFLLSLFGGHVVGNFSPHEAFAIGGSNSVRGYEEGSVGSGRSYVVGSGEISFPMMGPVDGAVFADYGSDLGSGPTVPGERGKENRILSFTLMNRIQTRTVKLSPSLTFPFLHGFQTRSHRVLCLNPLGNVDCGLDYPHIPVFVQNKHENVEGFSQVEEDYVLRGDPAGARLKPGSGYGYGFGIRVDSPLEYAFNDKQTGRFHFGVCGRPKLTTS